MSLTMAEFGDKSCPLPGKNKKQRQESHIFYALSVEILKIQKAEMIFLESRVSHPPQPELRQKWLTDIYVYTH